MLSETIKDTFFSAIFPKIISLIIFPSEVLYIFIKWSGGKLKKDI